MGILFVMAMQSRGVITGVGGRRDGEKLHVKSWVRRV